MFGGPQLTKEPTSIEIKIFKWFFAPIAIIVVAWALIGNSVNRNKCENICEEKGYSGFRHVPPGKGMQNNKCFCLTKEETENQNNIPKGTQVY